MAGFPEIKTAIDQQAEAFAAFRNANDNNISSLRDRLECLESGTGLPGKTKSDDAAGREHMQRFFAWMQRPNDSATKNALGTMEERLVSERKLVSIGSDAGGGFAVPEQIARDVERLELEFSPVRRLVKTIRVNSSDFKSLVNIRGASSGWVGETGTRSETDTPLLRERVPTMGELFAYPQHTEWSGDDMFFNVGEWLSEEVAQSFAVAEGAAVLTGDGSNKLTGMLNAAPVATADFASPLRDASAYQFVPSLSTSSPAVAEIEPDALVDLVYSLNSAYRSGATWIMNSSTAGAIRKLKDSTGQYLWQQSLAAGTPDTLLGYRVETWEQLDDIGTNNFPVAFGNFRRGYLLADRTTIRITIDSNISQPGRIKYFVRRREGGCVLNCDAIKWLKTTIS